MNLINTVSFTSRTDTIAKRNQTLPVPRLYEQANGIIQPKFALEILTYRHKQPLCGFT